MNMQEQPNTNPVVDSASEPVIRIEHLFKSFGENKVLPGF